MYREQYEDDRAADSLLKLVLTRYPHSDYVPDALDILGLRGTAADTGYAEQYIHRAENFLVDEENPDSAMVYYQYVVDNFPESQYYLQARFSTIWLQRCISKPAIRPSTTPTRSLPIPFRTRHLPTKQRGASVAPDQPGRCCG